MTTPSTRRVFFTSLCAAPLAAADFWEQKSFSDWSEKEVARILNDSPWARSVSLSMGSAGGGGGRSRGGGGGGGRGGRGGGPGDGGGSSSNMEMAEGGMRSAPSMNVLVRWATALPVRQAFAASQGKEFVSSEKAKSDLARELPVYVIHMLGIPGRMMRGDAGQLKTALKTNTSLNVKGKEPIVPTVVDLRQQGQSIIAVFQFEKGKPIDLDDKEVEFATKIGTMAIKRKFKLKDMVFNGKLAL